MISEPIELILAVVLVTIAIATAISFSRVVTKQELASERVLARSIASIIGDIYARDFVMYGNLTLQEFKNKVGEICTLVWNRTGIWFNVSMYLVFLNGSEAKFYINSTNANRPRGDVVIITIPVMPGTADQNITWYWIPYRDEPILQENTGEGTWESEPIFYIVAYTRDGMPVQGGRARVRIQIGSDIWQEGADVINGICEITIRLGGSLPSPIDMNVRVYYTDPDGQTTSSEKSLNFRLGTLKGKQQKLVNETADEVWHFYIGDTIYASNGDTMNLTNIRELIPKVSLPLTLDELIYAQGPYNATVYIASASSDKANIPFFIFPYTVRIEVKAVAPRG
ncbi:MAG TPA: hypothetical protein EYP68_06990 [Candidatus Korarchaeota archaeon]|nr:hypothetical protein [Candidatus Korarchaeota archaeon]